MPRSMFDSCSFDRKEHSIDRKSIKSQKLEFSSDCSERLKKIQAL